MSIAKQVDIEIYTWHRGCMFIVGINLSFSEFIGGVISKHLPNSLCAIRIRGLFILDFYILLYT